MKAFLTRLAPGIRFRRRVSSRGQAGAPITVATTRCMGDNRTHAWLPPDSPAFCSDCGASFVRWRGASSSA